MTLTIGSRRIDRVLIVDDEPAARDGYAYPIEDMGLEPVKVPGPVVARTFIDNIRQSDAILCDYHLKKHDYAECDGDVLTAECFKAGVPAILCTTFSDIDVTIRRDCLRYIPALRKTISPTPEELQRAWEMCLTEMNGKFHHERRPWRTLIRVIELERDYFYAVVPSWDHRQKIRIYNDNLPERVRQLLAPDRRFHAKVNKGAKGHQDLFFVDWEID